MTVTEAAIEAPESVRHADVTVSDGVRIHVMEAGEGVPVSKTERRAREAIAGFVRAHDPS